ncbi:MAG: hypothetical protein KTR31_29080 [Myxococcales bacterium]|nr:hypothetical protein [Myxococcales bacterium]
MSRIPGLCLLVPLSACNFDAATGVGELGNLAYVVSTDFDIEESILDVRFATRHAHTVGVAPTEQGSERFDDVEEWRHRSDDADVLSDGVLFDIRRDLPGSATVQTLADGEDADRIMFTFDDPASMEVVAWARYPWTEDWRPLLADTPVPLGTQIAFLGVPLASDGERLFTEEPVLVDAAPTERVVPDVPVDDVWENGPRNFRGYEAVTFYVIEEGPVVFSLSLAEHELAQEFVVGVQN